MAFDEAASSPEDAAALLDFNLSWAFACPIPK